MTELRAQGDIQFSERLLEVGRNEPELWKEIRQFFRRKEFATAMLVHADDELVPGDELQIGNFKYQVCGDVLGRSKEQRAIPNAFGPIPPGLARAKVIRGG